MYVALVCTLAIQDILLNTPFKPNMTLIWSLCAGANHTLKPRCYVGYLEEGLERSVHWLGTLAGGVECALAGEECIGWVHWLGKNALAGEEYALAGV